ncbi:MAG: hypothetical protein JO128_12215 [Alphaproteobacteria bacterium]|nr:hypothetical protein [Alphaproteobacteria bacterium]
MTLPDGRAGRSLALAIAVGAAVLVYLSAVDPLIGLYGTMQDELNDLALRRAHLRKVAGEVPRLQAAVAEMKRNAAENGLWLSDPSDAVAAASLQARLQRLAASDRAEISAVENLSPKVEDGFHRVGVRATLSGDLFALTDLLRALTTSQPPLFVENLDVRNNGILSRQTANAVPPLNISFDVYGFRVDAPQKAAAR